MGENAIVDSLIDENIGLLRSGIDVMTSIPESSYREGADRASQGGVGRHFRHIIGFYECLVDPPGSVADYESRRRDPRLERDAKYAIVISERLMGKLEALRGSPPEKQLTVITEVHDAGGTPIRTTSSLGRELATLSSHTIHHYAIIALLLRDREVTLPDNFGIAPSTIRYLSSRES